MKSLAALSLLALALLGTSCRTAYRWQEFQTGPVTQAEVFDAIERLARTDGFAPGEQCDRGLAVWVSRWRQQQVGLGRPGRSRLHAEILVDQGSAQDGYMVRFRIERQVVEDLKKSRDPREEDWSEAGADTEREYLFGERLRRSLPPPVARAERS